MCDARRSGSSGRGAARVDIGRPWCGLRTLVRIGVDPLTFRSGHTTVRLAGPKNAGCPYPACHARARACAALSSTAPIRPQLSAVDLLKRDGELARVETAIASARWGVGAAVVVEGAAGIGKSAVLAAARAAAEHESVRVLRARGAELERDFAFGVVRQLFEPALRDAPESRRADLLQGPARLAARVLGLPGALADGEAPAAAP